MTVIEVPKTKSRQVWPAIGLLLLTIIAATLILQLLLPSHFAPGHAPSFSASETNEKPESHH